MLCVQVDSSVQKTSFYVSVSTMLQREVEMQRAAERMNIDRSRWSSSRLFSLWNSASHKGHNEIKLNLSPESSMKDYSTLRWKPWLTTCILDYYNTGTIRIPEDCLGSDILLALEYFGILTTSPDTFVFDSYHSYDRIKSWSSYFTHRNMIADWVLNDFRCKKGTSRVWVASPNSLEMRQSETILRVNAEAATVLSGGQLSCEVVYDIFCDNESDNMLSKEMPARKRQDFCRFLLRSISPSTEIIFLVEKVKITSADGRCITEKRPALRIRSESNQDHGRLQECRSGSSASDSSRGSQSKVEHSRYQSNKGVPQSCGSSHSSGTDTSDASGPLADESSVLDSPANYSAVQKAKIISKTMPDTQPKKIHEVVRTREQPEEQDEETSSALEQLQDSGGRARTGGYWEQMLAHLCEAVVPGPPQNNRSRSPVREVTMPNVMEGAEIDCYNISNEIDEFLKIVLEDPEDASESESSNSPGGRREKRERKRRSASRRPVKDVKNTRRSGTTRRNEQTDPMAKQYRHLDGSQNLSRTSALSHGKIRSQGTLSALNSEVRLPPREPRRAQPRDQFFIARRKKQQTKSNPPPRPPNAIFVPGNLSHNPADIRVPSKAKKSPTCIPPRHAVSSTRKGKSFRKMVANVQNEL